MTSYGAVEGWGTGIPVSAKVAHLTRRGRLVRTALLLALVLLVGLWLVGRLMAQPAVTEGAPASTVVPTLRVTVVEGDSLWAIARAADPAADPREVVLDIRALNGLTSNTIQPGQVLLVPRAR